MMEHPNLDFSADIIRASLKNLSYDNQLEDRAEYVFGLIERSNQKDKIKDAILNALATETKDPWALEQLFELAGSFVIQGDKQAEKAIYKRFGKKLIRGYEAVGDYTILEMGGKEGLLHMAKTIGKILEKKPDVWENTFRVRCFYLDSLSKKGHTVLKEAAANDRHIQLYYDALLKFKKRPRRKKKTFNYETLREKINADERIILSPFRASELSEADIKRLADDLLKEKTRVKQAKYLSVFEVIKYPYDYKAILEYAKKPYSRKDRLVECAVDALWFFKGDDIRRFALKQMRESSRPEVYAGLLINNYKQGDGKRLLDITEKTGSQDRLHNLAHACRDIYSDNKTKDCLEPLVALYNKLTCGTCREHVVEIMIENNVLPEKIWQEIRYDSEESLRELAETKGVKV